jgi:hypothetical protein
MRKPFAPLLVLILLTSARPAKALTFSCDASNDLYKSLSHGSTRQDRFDSPAAAIDSAPPASGVLILPRAGESSVDVDAQSLKAARGKKLRLFIECPRAMSGLKIGEPVTAKWERVVVASDAMRETGLPPMRILSAQQCACVKVEGVASPLLVLARVAGNDKAVYGLPREALPLLFKTPDGDWVSAAPISSFVTARYAPPTLWGKVWEYLLKQLEESPPPALSFTPTAWPTYQKDDALPAHAERDAATGFARWIEHSGLLVSPRHEAELKKLIATGVEITGPPSPHEQSAPGDGSLGILEGYASKIRPDGHQMRRTPIRADCQAESAMVLALAGDNKQSGGVAKNLLDFVYFNSDMCKGVRDDRKHPAYGLIAWGALSPAWQVANYGDDNARTILGTIAAAASLKSDRWDEPVLKALLANLRTTGKLGFRGDRIDVPALEQHGWRRFHDASPVNYALNFEAYLWACYLWAYQHTHEPEFLDKARTAIGMTMKVYPHGWRWADNMERARILLPLAWLVRVDDTPEHRAWLNKIASDLIETQDGDCGAVGEFLGTPRGGGGHYVVPASNEAYGTTETPLVQTNDDRVSDQLYTTGFALIGLHEAAAATGDAKLRAAEDKLAEYLVRIQVRSKTVPYLDGAWFRAFDFKQWDYWASSADIGWGAWSVEAGWCQAWTAATLALRERKTSMWEMTEPSHIDRQFPKLRSMMK